MAARVFEVPAIHCGHCKMAIESEVGQLADVASVAVDIETRTVTVSGDASDEAIVAAIDEAGYEVLGRR
jgi:copper chaperone